MSVLEEPKEEELDAFGRGSDMEPLKTTPSTARGRPKRARGAPKKTLSVIASNPPRVTIVSPVNRNVLGGVLITDLTTAVSTP